jgi:hypothetical protein
MSGPATHVADDERSFTSWKLDVLNAMLSDPDVTDSEFRVAAYVMRCVNQQTGEAYIGDDKLAIAIPRCDRQRVWRIRKSLTDQGWWEVDTGHGARASRYRFLDNKVPEIFDRLDFERAKLQAERMRRKAEGPVRAKPSDVVGSQRTDVADEQPVHLQGSPSPDSLPIEGRGYPHTREPVQALTREAASSRIVIAPGEVKELAERIAAGSFTRGMDRLTAAGPTGERWLSLVRSRGLTAAELAAAQAEVGARP